MSEAEAPIVLDDERRARVLERLRSEFEDARPEEHGGWSALCPLCDADARFQILPGYIIQTCPNGHDSGEIYEHRKSLGLEPESASRFQLESAATLLAELIPPVKWLLAPYISECSFGELVGPPGKGKTTFMAWCIAQMAAAGHRCAIIEEEGSRRGLQRLLRRALAAVGPEATSRVYFKHAARFSLMSQADVEELAEELRAAKIDFVLFDSFALVTPGLDEDKSKEVGPVIDRIKWLVHAVNCAAWMNHHSGKSHWRDGEIPRLGDGRGSSAIPGALDAELSMRPSESEDGFIEFDLFVTKMREGDDQVKPQHVRIDRAGDAATCEMEELAVAEAPTAKTSAVDKLIDLLMKDVRVPTSFETAQPAGVIAKALRVNRMECIRAIKALCDDGMFEANAVTAKPYKKYHRCNRDE